jgi:hypothetical protein
MSYLYTAVHVTTSNVSSPLAVVQEDKYGFRLLHFCFYRKLLHQKLCIFQTYVNHAQILDPTLSDAGVPSASEVKLPEYLIIKVRN